MPLLPTRSPVRRLLYQLVLWLSIVFLWVFLTALLGSSVAKASEPIWENLLFVGGWLVLTALVLSQAFDAVRAWRARPGTSVAGVEWKPPPELAEEGARLEAAAQANPGGPELAAAARFRADNGDLEGAEDRYVRAVRAAPKDPGILGQYAAFLASERADPAGAWYFYELALQQAPQDVDLLAKAGRVLWADGKVDEAERALSSALEVDPEHQATLELLAMLVHFERDDADRAAELYDRASPGTEDPSLLACHAEFLTRALKAHDRAEEAYRRALDLSPTSGAVHEDYGFFVDRVRGEPERAEELLRRAVELEPESPRRLSALGHFLLFARGQSDEAEGLHLRALELVDLVQPLDQTATIGAWAEFLIAEGRLEEGRRQVRRELGSLHRRTMLVLLGIIDRLEGKDDSAALGRLKTTIGSSYRPRWDIENVLGALEEKLEPEDLDLYRAIGEVIGALARPASLDALPRWESLPAIPAGEPWPDC